MSEEYRKKLDDIRWFDKRIRILRRDGFTCAWCRLHDPDGMRLEVHHFEYAATGLPWDVPDSWLITLCGTCHSTVMKSRHREKLITGAREMDRIAIRNELRRESEENERQSERLQELNRQQQHEILKTLLQCNCAVCQADRELAVRLAQTKDQCTCPECTQPTEIPKL